MNKGYVAFVGDTILGLNRNGNYEEINVREIGTIKTKRSGGHNVIIGTAAGAAVCGITVLTKDINTYFLNGDL